MAEIKYFKNYWIMNLSQYTNIQSTKGLADFKKGFQAIETKNKRAFF